MKTEFLQNFKVGEQPLPKEIIARRLNVCRQIRLLSPLKMRQFELYRAPYAKALKSLRFRGFRYFEARRACPSETGMDSFWPAWYNIRRN